MTHFKALVSRRDESQDVLVTRYGGRDGTVDFVVRSRDGEITEVNFPHGGEERADKEAIRTFLSRHFSNVPAF